MRPNTLSREGAHVLQGAAVAAQGSVHHKGTCSGNALRGFIKAFLTLYAIKYGLSFLPALITGRIWNKLSVPVFRCFGRPKTLIKIGGKDTISFALFLSVFISSYKASLCGFRRLRGKADGLNPFMAGCIAGTSILLDQNRSRRIMIALYLSTRTLHFVCRWIWQRRLEERITGRRVSTVLGLEDMESELSGGSSPSNIKKQNSSLHHQSRKHRSHGTVERSFESIKVESSAECTPLMMAKSIEVSPVSPKETMDSRMGVIVAPTKSASEIQKENEKIFELRKQLRYAAGTMVMMLSSSQILMAYVLEPQSVASSYQSFLLTHGGIRTHQPKHAKDYLDVMGHVIRAGANGFSTTYLSANQPMPADFTALPPSFESNFPAGVDLKRFEPYFDYISQAPHKYLMCSLQHPKHTSCELGAAEFFGQEWVRAMQLYIPLNAIMTLVFKGNTILKNPGKNLYHYLTGTVRSCLFLSSYCAMAWYSICCFRRINKKDSMWMYWVNGMLSGATVLLEAPGRRLELGLYCLPRALESFWKCGVKWGWWRDIHNGEGIYFCLMTGVLMTLYQKDPASIHEGYRKVMYRFFGIN
ncbi:hypothetical protein HDU80_005291 [Chytriomyces hyalinus]|nr:hypothetical protein HDU80_005291 [Chytriomyces hyalinus]